MQDSDPVVAALPVERPDAFDRMSPSERGRRARFFFIARGAGFPEIMSWFLALADDDASMRVAAETLAAIEDDAILAIARNLTETAGQASFWRLASPRLARSR